MPKTKPLYRPVLEFEKNLLLWFMMEYNEKVNDLIHIPVFEREDFEEIKSSWSNIVCNSILDRMDPDEPIYNPWCLDNSDCKYCNYGKRYGLCKSKTSKAYKIRKALVIENLGECLKEELLELWEDLQSIQDSIPN